jgi:uncharacterized membrane protein
MKLPWWVPDYDLTGSGHGLIFAGFGLLSFVGLWLFASRNNTRAVVGVVLIALSIVLVTLVKIHGGY